MRNETNCNDSLNGFSSTLINYILHFHKFAGTCKRQIYKRIPSNICAAENNSPVVFGSSSIRSYISHNADFFFFSPPLQNGKCPHLLKNSGPSRLSVMLKPKYFEAPPEPQKTFSNYFQKPSRELPETS